MTLSREELYIVSSIRSKNQPAISVNRNSYLQDEPKFLSTEDESAQALLIQNEYRCIYCGFKSKTNKVLKNTEEHPNAVICSLCTAPITIRYSLQMNLGEICILPELTQTEINNLFRWFFLAEYAFKLQQNKTSWIHTENNEFKQKIKDIIVLKGLSSNFKSMLFDRSEAQIRSFFNCSLPSQILLPMTLLKLDSETYNERSTKLAALKFIPNRNAIPDEELQIILKEIKFDISDLNEIYDELGLA